MKTETVFSTITVFDTFIEVPVTVTANICPASGDGWSEPFIPAHPEEIVISFDAKKVQAELDRVADEEWLTDLIMEKLAEKRGETLADTMLRDHPLGGLRPVTVRPIRLSIPDDAA